MADDWESMLNTGVTNADLTKKEEETVVISLVKEEQKIESQPKNPEKVISIPSINKSRKPRRRRRLNSARNGTKRTCQLMIAKALSLQRNFVELKSNS